MRRTFRTKWKVLASSRDWSGITWTAHGAVTLSKLAREIEAPRDLVMQGVGWLAREGKIAFHEGPRSKTISLV